MAPALSALWGSGVTGSEVGAAVTLANGELALVGTLTALSAFLLLAAIMLLLCASCQGQKKANQHPGDHENLMNGETRPNVTGSCEGGEKGQEFSIVKEQPVSEKETCSQSADTGSHGTDLVASSSQNGPLTSGTVLTDNMDTSPHPSEEMLSSQSELRSSKCPQDRELPSIPPNSAIQVGIDAATTTSADAPGTSGDGTYEVVKHAASRDVSVEDSLYETVKELKDPCLPNGTLSPGEPPAPLVNGRLSPSPGTPERGSLPNGVEYASIDLNKKSRYSIDVDPRRSVVVTEVVEEPEDEMPPPVPDKVLDENDNQQINGLQNGQLHSPLPSTPEPENSVPPLTEVSAIYSTVIKPGAEKENDYSVIGEINGLVPESTSSDLYATVRARVPLSSGQLQEEPVENHDPGYETIKIPKTGEEGQQENGQVEHDYESVGELGLNKEISRL